jgi:hypothetical protein
MRKIATTAANGDWMSPNLRQQVQTFINQLKQQSGLDVDVKFGPRNEGYIFFKAGQLVVDCIVLTPNSTDQGMNGVIVSQPFSNGALRFAINDPDVQRLIAPLKEPDSVIKIPDSIGSA